MYLYKPCQMDWVLLGFLGAALWILWSRNPVKEVPMLTRGEPVLTIRAIPAIPAIHQARSRSAAPLCHGPVSPWGIPLRGLGVMVSQCRAVRDVHNTVTSVQLAFYQPEAFRVRVGESATESWPFAPQTPLTLLHGERHIFHGEASAEPGCVLFYDADKPGQLHELLRCFAELRGHGAMFPSASRWDTLIQRLPESMD